MKKSLIEIIPASTRGWMALIVLIVSLVNLTAAQWGWAPHGDPSVWRDILIGALGIHAGSRVLEERNKK